MKFFPQLISWEDKEWRRRVVLTFSPSKVTRRLLKGAEITWVWFDISKVWIAARDSISMRAKISTSSPPDWRAKWSGNVQWYSQSMVIRRVAEFLMIVCQLFFRCFFFLPNHTNDRQKYGFFVVFFEPLIFINIIFFFVAVVTSAGPLTNNKMTWQLFFYSSSHLLVFRRFYSP